jgi:oxygen-dependent protoporphyrinogen oxidase
MNPVAVVGGGITGLSAAYCLQRAGVPVTLYEKAPRTGGAIRSVVEQGFLTEDGPSQITETPEVAALIDNLQLASRRLYPGPDAKKRFIVKNGRPMPLPSSPGSFLSTKLFSAGGKLRLFAEPFISRGDQNREESVAEFIRRRLGPEILDYAVDPLISGIFAGDPYRISLRMAFPKLYEMEQASGSLTGAALGSVFHKPDGKSNGKPKEKKPRGRVLFSFDQGCQVLPDALAASLGSQIQLSSAVNRISRANGSWEVDVTAEGRQHTHSHSAVLLTAPAYELAGMTGGASPMSALKDIVYPPIARVTLGFREEQFPEPVRGFGFLVPGREHFQVLGTVFASCVYPGRAPQGCVNLSSYLGGLRHPDIASLTAAQRIEATLSDYRTLLGVKGDPIFSSEVFIPNAIPQYMIGYGRYKDLMADMERSSPGLFFAGNYRDGISVADSIGSGVKASQRLKDFLHA